MNLSGPIWGSLIPDATTNTNQTNTIAGSNGSLSLSNNQTDAIVGAIASSGSYLWSFKMYWVITAPVTLGTILLPLIAGHIVRSISHFGYKNEANMIILSAILTVGFNYLFFRILPIIGYFVMVRIFVGGGALIAAVYSAWNGRYQWLSAGLSTVLAAAVAMDWYVDTVFPMTGVVPSIYIALLYIRVKIEDFLGPRLITCRLYMIHPLRSHSWIWQAVIVCIYYTSAVSLSYWQQFPSIFVIGTPLGLLGLNRIVYSFANPRLKYKTYRIVYLLVYISSMLLGYFISTLCLALVPMTYLFAIWLYLGHKRWIQGQLWNLIRGPPTDRMGLAA